MSSAVLPASSAAVLNELSRRNSSAALSTLSTPRASTRISTPLLDSAEATRLTGSRRPSVIEDEARAASSRLSSAISSRLSGSSRRTSATSTPLLSSRRTSAMSTPLLSSRSRMLSAAPIYQPASAAVLPLQEAAIAADEAVLRMSRSSAPMQSMSTRPTTVTIVGMKNKPKKKHYGGTILLGLAAIAALGALIYAILSLVAKHKLESSFRKLGANVENFLKGKAPKAVAAVGAVNETAKETAADVKDGAKKVASAFFDGSVPQLENERDAMIVPLTARHFNNIIRVKDDLVLPAMDSMKHEKRAIVIMIFKRGNPTTATCTASYAPHYVSVAKEVMEQEITYCRTKKMRISSRIYFTCIDDASIPRELVDRNIVSKYPAFLVYDPRTHNIGILDDNASPREVHSSIRNFYDNLNRDLWIPAESGKIPADVPTNATIPVDVPASAATPGGTTFQQLLSAFNLSSKK